MTRRPTLINGKGRSSKPSGLDAAERAPELLIATFDRIEIESSDSKQRTKQISNRNKNGTSGIRQLQKAGAISSPEGKSRRSRLPRRPAGPEVTSHVAHANREGPPRRKRRITAFPPSRAEVAHCAQAYN